MYRFDLIKGKMAQLDKTVEMLGDETGLSPDTIVRVRKGENVAVETLKKVAEALDLSLPELFTDAKAA
jgi:DNA-binding Xre family transcriptional regulator